MTLSYDLAYAVLSLAVWALGHSIEPPTRQFAHDLWFAMVTLPPHRIA